MEKNPFPWDLPAGTSDGDPRAPWNAKDHCRCCPCHEDAPEQKDEDGKVVEPQCTCDECECGERDWDAVNDARRDR